MMSAIVLVWDFLGTKTAFGHASILLDDGTPNGFTYISWWPNCHPVGDGNTTKMREYFGKCDAHRDRTIEKDIESEVGHGADRNVILRGLDEAAMKKWWNNLMANENAYWKAADVNCAAVVIAALTVGGANKHLDVLDWAALTIHHNPVAWTPAGAYEFAYRVQQNLIDAEKK
jgi:hypothetical protein